jgi:integrase
LTLAEATRIVREATRDKSYQACPIGHEVAGYLRAKRVALTERSYLDYEQVLDKFARYFADLEGVRDLEPPLGIERLEEFLQHQWGDAAPRTYNKGISVVSDFLKWARVRGLMYGSPAESITRAKKRDVHRTVFSDDARRAIIASQDELRDRIALRLLFDYGLRKGALRKVQFRHFDYQRRRLTVFTKGQKVREMPIPDPHLWTDLERHVLEIEAKPDGYLMASSKVIPYAGLRYFPDRALADSGMHRWWYRCLARAGVVPEGVESGERMHKARHTAGQRVLDKTGNLKAVQSLLGHESIQTTGDIYTDWDIVQLEATMGIVLDEG